MSQLYGVVLGVVFDTENQKKQFTSAGTSQKKWSKFGVKNFDRVFWLVPALSSARELFFLILCIKNYPQNHSIVLGHEVTYGLLIFTCRTLLTTVIPCLISVKELFSNFTDGWLDFKFKHFSLHTIWSEILILNDSNSKLIKKYLSLRTMLIQSKDFFEARWVR